MQHLKLFSAIVLSSFLIYSCTGNTNANAGKESDSVASSGTAASTSDASFSYKIDGKVYSWSGNDAFANRASMDSTNEVFFTLMSNDPVEKNPPQFGFGIASEGTTAITYENMDRFKSSGSNGGNHFANFRLSYPNQDAKYPDYEFDTKSTVTIAITSKSETRIAGTFSGELINAATQKPALLTDGKFDLPFKPYSKK